MLVNFMGQPPEEFNWTYKTGDEEVEQIDGLTPVSFYNTYITPYYDVNNKVVLIHDPRKTSVYNQCYTPEHFCNMVNGHKNIYFNVRMSVMKKAVISSIVDRKEGVWFACDVGKDYLQNLGVLDNNAYDHEKVLNVTFNTTKENRLIYRRSTPAHAMLIVGLHLDNNSPSKWRIENSWGHEDHEPDPGHLQMSDSWFTENVFEVVVDKSCISQKILLEFNKTELSPIELKFNDPFGTVAKCNCKNRCITKKEIMSKANCFQSA